MNETQHRAELRRMATELAFDTARWTHLVRHDPAQRVFESIEIGPDVGVWLICWMPGHDTGLHDHDISSGAVAVVRGALREEHMLEDGTVTGRVHEAGDVFDFGPNDIHRMVHTGDEPAVSIHLYSPRLQVMGAYAVGDGGRVVRTELDSSVELRPLTLD
jgi:predicted metal-dependent enzyme (double-stranded beta helix superfamily)